MNETFATSTFHRGGILAEKNQAMLKVGHVWLCVHLNLHVWKNPEYAWNEVSFNCPFKGIMSLIPFH